MEGRWSKENETKVPVNWKKHSGAYGSGNNGKIEEYENEREGADVDSETACTDMRRAEECRLETGRRCQKI